jgi:hypothetical protein
MSTYCALHVQTQDRQSIVGEIERYLAFSNRGRIVQTTAANTIGKLYGDEFICSQQQPSKFAIMSEQPRWLTIHYNSFLPVRELAADISRRVDTVAIIVMAQSVSSAYYLSVYRAGEHLRTIEFADGEWIRQEGTPLSFEPSPLGTNIADEGEEPCYCFENESVRQYCEHFGLKLWEHAWLRMPNPEWTIVRI